MSPATSTAPPAWAPIRRRTASTLTHHLRTRRRFTFRLWESRRVPSLFDSARPPGWLCFRRPTARIGRSNIRQAIAGGQMSIRHYSRLRRAGPVASALLLPTAALAHPAIGPAAGFAYGFVHPIGGIDHVLAMLAVGLLAANLGGRALC